VLLVDGDLRERRVTQARVGSVGQGLTEVLERQVPLQEAVVDDPSGRLKILPAVVGSDMTTPRITAMQLREVLLPQAKPAYDLIVVDGGLIDAERSARVFFDAADDVLVTARQGSTIRGALADLMARLGPASDKLRGSVLQSR
jgi:Mrp family chromosome partitioning ATPase